MLNDKKVRFQHSSFRRQLQDAREYKRAPRKIPERSHEIFLSKIGLGSLKAKILVTFAALLAVYILFIPNTFFVKNVEVKGLPDKLSEQVTAVAKKHMRSGVFSVQRNLLLLSTSELSASILEQEKDVLKISSVEKKYPNSVIITAEPRVNKFILQTSSGMFLLSSDGLVRSQVATTSQEDLVKIEIRAGKQPEIQHGYLPEELSKTLISLHEKLGKDSKTAVAEFVLQDLQNPDVEIITAHGYKVLIDRNSDVSKIVTQLSLILADVTEANSGQIGYIDLRLQSRGFLCMKSAPCIIDHPLSKPEQSTSTEEYIP